MAPEIVRSVRLGLRYSPSAMRTADRSRSGSSKVSQRWRRRTSRPVASASSQPDPRTVWTLLDMEAAKDHEREVLQGTAETANLFLRRELYDSVSGFDDSIPEHGDFDFVAAVHCFRRVSQLCTRRDRVGIRRGPREVRSCGRSGSTTAGMPHARRAPDGRRRDSGSGHGFLSFSHIAHDVGGAYRSAPTADGLVSTAFRRTAGSTCFRCRSSTSSCPTTRGWLKPVAGSTGGGFVESGRVRSRRTTAGCSSGGHLLQLHALRDAWRPFVRCWVSFDKSDVRSLLADERLIVAYGPTNRSLKNPIKNLARGLRDPSNAAKGDSYDGRRRRRSVRVDRPVRRRARDLRRELDANRRTLIELSPHPTCSCARLPLQWPELEAKVPGARYAGSVFAS